MFYCGEYIYRFDIRWDRIESFCVLWYSVLIFQVRVISMWFLCERDWRLKQRGVSALGVTSEVGLYECVGMGQGIFNRGMRV